MLKYLKIVSFFSVIGCAGKSSESLIVLDTQQSPVYYKHDLTAKNAKYQSEINVHMDMLYHEKKHEIGDFELLGSWFGKTNNTWISLNITSTSNQMLRGFIITDTIYHSFQGWFSSDDHIHYKLGITEKIDSNIKLFNLQLSLENMTMSGITKFIDNQDKDSVLLQKRNYEYDVTLGTYPEFSQRLITSSELEELSKDELIYITEEILAKHGLIFFSNETRDMFGHKNWYIPLNFRVSELLTETEKLNLDNIYTFF